MAKAQSDTIYDAGTHAYVRVRTTRITVCSTQPSTYAAAFNTTSAILLAKGSTITSTAFTLADGDTSGRKITPAAQNGISVIRSGTAAHVAWVGSTQSILLLVTTCTTQALTAGNTVNVPAHDFEIRDVA